METTIMGYIATSIRIHSFIPSKPMASLRLASQGYWSSDLVLDSSEKEGRPSSYCIRIARTLKMTRDEHRL